MLKLLKWVLIILAVTAGIVRCGTTEWWQAEERKRAEELAEKRKPVIIARSDDGCAVYTFNAGGDWKYFTRCGADVVTTERNYTVQCGKSRCERTETISTEVKP